NLFVQHSADNNLRSNARRIPHCDCCYGSEFFAHFPLPFVLLSVAFLLWLYFITSFFLFQLLFVISVHLYIFYLSFLCISHTIFHLFFRFISFFRFVIFLTFFRKIYIALFFHFLYNKS